MLTVIRMAAAKATSAAEKGADTELTFSAAVSGAKAALKSTRNLLPVLKKKGIVDAGAQGLVYILEGMAGSVPDETASFAAKNSSAETDFVSEYTYCTEFIITKKSDINITDIKRFLAEIGDCPAAAEHSGIVKVHVHTDSPHLALQKGLEYGELSRIKIDNMKLQASASGK